MIGNCALAAAETPLAVIPAVREWQLAQGSLDCANLQLAPTASTSPGLAAVAAVIREDLAALNLTKAGQPIELRLEIIESAGANPEAYQVDVSDAINIRGATPTAVFLGSRTVLQLLRKSFSLPLGRIVDSPAYRGRMLMLDVGRKPYPIPVLRDFIRMMIWYKMNELHLHLSDEAFGGTYAAFRMESKTFPGLAAKDLCYTHAEIRELQDFAKARGITITPEIDMPAASPTTGRKSPSRVILERRIVVRAAATRHRRACRPRVSLDPHHGSPPHRRHPGPRDSVGLGACRNLRQLPAR